MAEDSSHILEQEPIRDTQQGFAKCVFCAKDIYEGEVEEVHHPTLCWHRGTCFRCYYCALPLVPGRPYVCTREGATCMLCFADSRNLQADNSWQEDVTVYNRTRRVQFSHTASQRLYSPEGSEIEPFCDELPPSPSQRDRGAPHSPASIALVNENGPGVDSSCTSASIDVLMSPNHEANPAEAFVEEGIDLNASCSLFNDISDSSEANEDQSSHENNGSEPSDGQGKVDEVRTGSCCTPPITRIDLERPCPSQAVTSSPCSTPPENSGDFVSSNESTNTSSSESRGGSPCDNGSIQENTIDRKETQEELALSAPVEIVLRASPARTIYDLRTPSPPCYGCGSPTNRHLMMINRSPAGKFQSSTPERTPPGSRVRLGTSCSTESILDMNHCLEASTSRTDFPNVDAGSSFSRHDGSYQTARQRFIEVTGSSTPNAVHTQKLCKSCHRPVFQIDRLNILNGLYHHSCFKCSKCLVHLNATNFLDKNGQAFCRRCYSASAMSASYFPSPAYAPATQSGNDADARSRTKTI